MKSLLIILSIALACCQQQSKQIDEHPKGQAEKTPLTIKEFADAADEYISRESKMNDGYFLVKDKKENAILELQLIKIHKERLSTLGDDTYFVCADFKGKDGKTYDIDIFMQGASKDGLKPTEKIVHKVNSQPRCTWYEEDGIWKQKEQ